MKAKAIQPLAENMAINLGDFGLSNGFLRKPAAQEAKRQITWMSSWSETFVF